MLNCFDLIVGDIREDVTRRDKGLYVLLRKFGILDSLSILLVILSEILLEGIKAYLVYFLSFYQVG